MKRLLIVLIYSFCVHTTFAQSESQEKVQKRVERDNPKPLVTVNPTPQPPRYIYTPTPSYNTYQRGWYSPAHPVYSRRYPVRYREPQTFQTQPRNSNELGGVGLDMYVTQTNPMLGAQGFIGDKNAYWLFGFAFSPVNPFSHFDNVTLSDVIRWEDDFVKTYKYNQIFKIGGGFRVGEIFYPKITIGGFTEKDYLVYYDELKILTSSGEYSINGGQRNLFIMDVGLNIHQKKWYLSTSTGVVGPRRFSIGLGLLFGE